GVVGVLIDKRHVDVHIPQSADRRDATEPTPHHNDMGAMFTGPMRASHDLAFTLPVVVLIAVLTVVALAIITLAAVALVALFLLLLLFVATVVLLGVIARGAEPESARDGRGRRQGPYASVTLT